MLRKCTTRGREEDGLGDESKFAYNIFLERLKETNIL